MWDLILPSPAQAHCQALVSKAGHWARWPRGRLLSGHCLLTCSGGVSPAGPLSARCWASSRFPALALPHRCWDSSGSLQPGASSARSGTEITMPRAGAGRRPAASLLGAEPARRRSSRAGRSAPARRAPLWRPGPSLRVLTAAQTGSSLPANSAPASPAGSTQGA